MSEYIPGVCNIGPAEIKRRRSAGIGGLAITITLFVLFAIFHVPAAWRLIIFLPAMVTAVGFLQAWFHFCVNFAMRGLFNVSDELKHEESIDQQEYGRKDQQKAVLIVVLSVIFGALVAAGIYISA